MRGAAEAVARWRQSRCRAENAQATPTLSARTTTREHSTLMFCLVRDPSVLTEITPAPKARYAQRRSMASGGDMRTQSARCDAIPHAAKERVQMALALRDAYARCRPSIDAAPRAMLRDAMLLAQCLIRCF